MIKNRGLFEEEENRKRKPFSKNITNPDLLKTKGLFPIGKKNHKKSSPNSSVTGESGIKYKQTEFNTGSSHKKLIIKVHKKETSPRTTSQQSTQFLYISRIEKKEESEELNLKNKDTFLYDNNDKVIHSKEEIKKLAEDWNNDKNRRVGDVISRQLTISIGGKEDKQKVLIVTRKFLKDTFAARGFEYCYAPHYDSDNDHYHVIIKKRNKFGKNLTLYKKDLKKLLEKYNEQLAIIGINRDISARVENRVALGRIRSGIEGIRNPNNWYQNKLSKGEGVEFNAYNYKSTLSGIIEDNINFIKVEEYLKQLQVEDKGLINLVKPHIREKGIKVITESLLSVKRMCEKNQVVDINSIVIKAIKDEYKLQNKKDISSFVISHDIKEIIGDLKNIKEEILTHDNKEDIIKTLNSSVEYLKNKNSKMAPILEREFKDRNIRYSYIKQKDPVVNLEEIIEKKVDTQYKPVKQNYYRPQLTNYEIQEKFADFIKQETDISAVGLETAIANAFANPSQKIRFGYKKQNEVRWHGEVGYIKNYKTGEHQPWGINKIRDDGSIVFKKMSQEEVEEKQRIQEEQKKKLELAKIKQHKVSAERSEKFFNKLSNVFVEENKYLKKKQVSDIKLYNVKCNVEGDLVVPLHDVDNKIWNLQTIDKDGNKKFEYGAKKQGNFFVISQDKNNFLKNSNKPLLLVEGLATGLTVHRASGNLDTVVCFDANNIVSVISNIKEKYPNQRMVIMADDDQRLEKKAIEEGRRGINAGLLNAYKAQNMFPDVVVIKPSLTEQEKVGLALSDFNDLEKVRGKEFVKNEVGHYIGKISFSNRIKI